MSQRYIGGLIYNPPGGWSGQFGAASNTYLTTASDAAFAFGTGDFTMEAFAFATTSQTDNWIIGLHNNCWLRIGASGVLEFYNAVASSSVAATAAMPLNQWIHVAAVRSGTTLTIYQNGVSVASGTVSTNFSTSVACTIGGQVSYDRRWNGYISNVRVVKGTAVYTAAFTPPNGPLQNITNTSLLTCRYPTFVDGSNNAFTLTNSGGVVLSTQNPFPLTTLPNPALGNQGNGIYSMSQYQSLLSQNLWPALDPYFENVTLLLHGNGTNGAQNNTFLDSSSNNFTITRNGDTTQGTFSPFSQTGWSNYFDGSGDYLTLPSNSAFSFGTGNFTAECWVYFTSLPAANQALFDFRDANDNTSFEMGVYSNYIPFFANSSGGVLNGSFTFSVGTWYHIAFTRSGTSLNIWVNGTNAGSTTNSTNLTGTNCKIGASVSGGDNVNGYISNARVVKGTAVYTAAFTPSTTPLTAISGTSLLTCQSNRFVDNGTANSGSGFTITVNGNTSVQAFSPFNPTAAYSAATVGGSGYFDGTGDYLTAPDNAVFDFGTSAFTIECWVYFNNISGDQYVLSYDTGTTPDQNGINIYSGSWRIGGFNSYLITGSTGLIAQQWIHVAMTRDSNTLRAYINGVQLGTSDVTGVTFDATGAIHIGSIFNPAGSFTLNGYLSGLRITKGGCLYPSGTTFTVPTSPPTTTVSAGTVSLLLNFTNAGILDSTAKNDLVTVNSAQISTAQSKFGGSSMLFDGTTDYLTLQTNPDLALGSGDWTVECWVYLNATANEVTVFGSKNYYVSGKNGNFVLRVGNSNVFYVFNGQTAVTNISPSSNWSTGVWTHAAWVRSSGTVTVYRNGVSIGSAANTTDLIDSANGGYIAVNFSNGSLASGTELNGYIDDLRITKGIARYTTNFTPQRSQWQDQ